MQTPAKVLITPRLILRPFEDRDAERMFAIMSDDETTRFLHVNPYESPEQARAWIERCLSEGDGEYFRRAIELKETGEYIGDVRVKLNHKDNSGEIGFTVSREYWGKGLASEAAGEVITYLMEQRGINRIAAAHSVKNPASGGVLRKIGMQYEGMARELYRNRMGYHDCHRYAILKSDISR